MKYLIFINSPGLGDMMVGMATMQRYHELGYKVILPLAEEWQPALEKCPFIHKIISIKIKQSHWELYRRGKEVKKLETDIATIINKYLYEINANKAYYVIASGPLFGLISPPFWHNIGNKINADHIAPIEYDKSYPLSYVRQAHCGLKPIITCPAKNWFERVKIKLPEGFKIGLCFGSQVKNRRLSPRKVSELINTLSPIGSIIILGGVHDQEYFSIDSNSDSYFCFDRKIKLPINYCLSAMEQLDVFISPDSGLLHCCYPMKAHIIAFQSNVFADFLWEKRKNMDIIQASDYGLSCNKKCNAKLTESLINIKTIMNQPVNSIKRGKHTPNCFKLDSTPCLEIIDIQKIQNIVQKIKNKYIINSV